MSKVISKSMKNVYNVHLLLPRFSHLVALTLPMRKRQNSSYFSESLIIINIIFYIVAYHFISSIYNIFMPTIYNKRLLCYMRYLQKTFPR